MRSWTQFYPDVLQDVLGCPEPTVDLHLMRAAREFCRRTKAWRTDLPTISTLANQRSYAIRYPAQADLVEFVGGTINGQDIGVEGANATSTRDRLAGNTGPARILTTDARTIVVMPTPAAAAIPIILTAVLQPSETAQGVPDFLGDEYRGEIATGALVTLLKINKAEWRNQALAEDKAAAFNMAIARIQTRVWRALTNARPRTRPEFY